MATTVAANLQGDVQAYLDREVLPLAQKQLVVHQFGQKHTLPKGRGLTMTFTRYNRFALPFAPLAEGVPPPTQQLTIQTVTGMVQQWGCMCTLTDVVDMTVFHDPFQQAKKLQAIQVAETMERNDFLTLMGCTQVNYVNQRGSRASLVAGDVLDPFTVQRTQVSLSYGGAPMFNGPMEPDVKEDIRTLRQGKNTASAPHYVAVGVQMAIADLRQNPAITNAWSFSQIDSLYNNEVGQWSLIRFCQSNMVPGFTGVANTGINPTPGTSGSLATGTYYVQLTGVDTQNQYESRIYQVSSSQSVTGPNGSITVTTPNIAGFTFSAYIGTTSSPANLATSASGPTSGPMAGQAVQLPANSTIVLTGTGIAQTPPAAPASGVTVWPTFVFGQDAFGVINFDRLQNFYLTGAEKADPLNQTRVVATKFWQGAMLLNTAFMARIESSSAFTAAFG